MTPPSSPNLTVTGVNGTRGRAVTAVGTTPPTAHPSTRFHLKLPPSCPPSPPLPQTVVPPIVSDTPTVCDLLSSLLRPDKESTRLAREAVSDACDGLKALLRLME